MNDEETQQGDGNAIHTQQASRTTVPKKKMCCLEKNGVVVVGWANKNPVIMIIKYSTLCCLQHADDEIMIMIAMMMTF